MNLPKIDALDLTGVRTEVMDGMAVVETEEAGGRRIAGIWCRRLGGLVDNKRDGSAEWTRDVADRVLAEAGL